jgi:uncharacterized protein (UPF0332 family)
MTGPSVDYWSRALDAIRAARFVLSVSVNTAASRAYYAAFYAVSAHFALEGKTFKKHSAVEAAVHRDLAKPGLWPRELAASYSSLYELRSTADYGASDNVTPSEASMAVRSAAEILRAVASLHPQDFTVLEEI